MKAPNKIMKRGIFGRPSTQSPIIMLSVSGIIGAGFLMGIGDAVSLAGPSIILTFFLIGIAAVFVNFFLIEMSLSGKGTSFHQYVGKAFGPLAGTTVSWAYTMGMVVGPASEIIAAGVLLNRWFPQMSLLKLCISVAAFVIVSSFFPKRWLTKLEFITAFLRIFVLLGFSLLGLASILGLFTGSIQAVGFSNYAENGGFFPHGLTGTMTASIGVVMAYGGTESVGIFFNEDTPHNQASHSITYNTAFRIMFLYCFAISILVGVLPWDSATTTISPFAQALGILNCHPIVILLLNIVIFSSIITLAVIDVNLASRLLQLLTEDGYFPRTAPSKHRRWQKLNVPLTIWVVLLLSVLSVALWKDTAYLRLLYLSGFGFSFIWIMITLSYPRYCKIIHKSHPELQNHWRVPHAKLLQLYVLTVLTCGTICFASVPLGRTTLLIGVLWLLTACGYYAWKRPHS